ncbi:MAG: metalloregulator ArsR/SmtB family transcription factor [Chelatococcus sp.]|uniref:ArsR/SmtB family transcription factor n=1 Tax=unclassified Chelatococcus TaxID=2638111 RepID=UPI001BCD7A66|nr:MULTISPECIES: metalloregulator ArsR/SmtB family transcription factor [unclassified Chelatococcus]MBS7737838.1 metalloregulator ArsR/SmtB family transcription factor [Chelatococcus sp. HY11]MBX3540022.1 metalloregulator ArsR/SmtB family transcription factor [Chelatococcus sp.]MBX3546714.1 metalloregulator ArsR/SmtB family transcription factor [Chelatococcus sp.]MCO5079292.1 metalloregulator ArsR/SmtB family transcription factor [Chelatococcus sp.]
MDRPALPFPVLLTAMKAAAEETRMRMLALLSEGELTVSDMTDILGQSQPRISRHLKLLAEAGIVERHREGAWAFFRMADHHPAATAIRDLVAHLDSADQRLAGDRARLKAARQARAEAAQAHFSRLADNWDKVRSLHVPEEAVEAAIIEVVGAKPVQAFLDLGTGTGRMLQLLAPLASRVVGVDASHAMLSVARANLERAGLAKVQLQQGDIHALPVEHDAFDLVLIHQVLHYLDDPARALREAAAVLAPGGRLLVVDFAPHALEFLREEHAHRRLGFAADQIGGWLEEAGLDVIAHRDLKPERDHPEQLTVSLWLARDRRVITDFQPRSTQREVA